jgi:hypothetical protein
MSKQRLIDKVTAMLRQARDTDKSISVVAKEIIESLPLIPHKLWVVATDIDNVGRNEFLFTTKPKALAWADKRLRSWIEEIGADYEDFEDVKTAILADLDRNRVLAAIEKWNDYDNLGADQAQMFVFQSVVDKG